MECTINWKHVESLPIVNHLTMLQSLQLCGVENSTKDHMIPDESSSPTYSLIKLPANVTDRVGVKIRNERM